MVGVTRELLFREAAADSSIPGVIFTFVWGLDLPDDTAFLRTVCSLFTDNGGQVIS
jgi:hypothetical protein